MNNNPDSLPPFEKTRCLISCGRTGKIQARRRPLDTGGIRNGLAPYQTGEQFSPKPVQQNRLMKSRIIFALTIAVAFNAFAQKTPHCGTVRYPSGEPAAGVQVTFYPGSYYSDEDYNYHDAITDKNGHYEIVPPKKVTNVRWGMVCTTNCIMARDIEKNFAAVEAFPIAATNVNLTLQPAITLSGSVENTEGAPVGGAEITLGFMVANYGPEIRPPFKANEQGQFSIPALPQGIEYGIRGITAKGYGSSYASIKAEHTQTNHYQLPTFVLKHADHPLAGRVVDNQGKPLVGTRVSFSGAGQPQNNGTNTDSDGRFFFAAVCDGPIKIFAHYADPQDTSIYMNLNGGGGMDVQAGDTNLAVLLCNQNAPSRAPLWTTIGTVFDLADKPVMGASLAVWHSANPFWNFQSDRNGKYKVHWQGNSASLVARDPEHNLVITHDLDETTTNLNLHLQTGCSLSGSVQDINGKPFTNAAVSLNMSLKNAGAELSKVQPDANGFFSFKALPQEAEYRLEVRATSKTAPWWQETGDTAKTTGYAAATLTTNFTKTSQSIHLPPFQLTPANLQLAGTVVDHFNNHPIAGMRVNAWGPSQMLIANTVTDANGHFAFDHVGQGSIRVMACIVGIINNQSYIQAKGGDTNIVLRLQAP